MKLEQYLINERSFVTAKNAKDLQLLGLGCLLHDVGKMCIPLEILNKPAKLTAEEMAAMELHTIYGYEMVKGQIPATAAQIVLNHHQRFNGTGYPKRFDPVTKEQLPALSGKQIPVFSRIATVCDVYDAATAHRVYSPAKLPVRVLHEMRTWCKGFFDPICEQAFYEIIPPFPLGQIVKLSNGFEAVVVDFNAKHPVRPKVQGIRDPNGDRVADPAAEEIDLVLHRELSITHVDETDVTPFLASQDKAPGTFATIKN
jgi:HD-GYP domain-containing protein (c-di-GMP phosphodiesterase class II)